MRSLCFELIVRGKSSSIFVFVMKCSSTPVVWTVYLFHRCNPCVITGVTASYFVHLCHTSAANRILHIVFILSYVRFAHFYILLLFEVMKFP